MEGSQQKTNANYGKLYDTVQIVFLTIIFFGAMWFGRNFIFDDKNKEKINFETGAPEVINIPEKEPDGIGGEESLSSVTIYDINKGTEFVTPAGVADSKKIVSIIENQSAKIVVSAGVKDIKMDIVADMVDVNQARFEYQYVYFYVDEPENSGALNAYRTNQNRLDTKSPGVFSIKDRELPIIFSYDLTQDAEIAHTSSQGEGGKKVNYFNILSIPGEHKIFVFVSPPGVGRINELTLYYSCDKAYPKCSIELEK